jgi:hypothetical protein
MTQTRKLQTKDACSPPEPQHPPLRSSLKDIALPFLIILIPMTVFSVVLLELVRRHIILPNPASVSIQYQDYSRVFYVSINATKLVFISSWSSSVAPAC